MTCNNPGIPKNGRMFPDRLSYVVGQKISFSCKDGYELLKGSYTLVCEDSGKFSEEIPDCIGMLD